MTNDWQYPRPGAYGRDAPQAPGAGGAPETFVHLGDTTYGDDHDSGAGLHAQIGGAFSEELVQAFRTRRASWSDSWVEWNPDGSGTQRHRGGHTDSAGEYVEYDESVPFEAAPPTSEVPCRVYWGSHGCFLERGHGGGHDCLCCGEECTPEKCDEGCVSRPPYYGWATRFYGDDAPGWLGTKVHLWRIGARPWRR